MSSVTEEIKARIDIVSYVGQYAALKKSGRYYKACCPFHSEKTPSFIVNPDTQSWRCFGACAEGGDLFSFAMKQHGWSFSETVQELGRQAGVEVHKQTPEQRQQTEHLDRLRGLLQTAADMYHQNLVEPAQAHERARAVLRYAQEKRGFTEQTIHDWGIGYAPAGWQTTLEQLIHLGYEQDDIIEAGLAIRNDKGRVYDRFRDRLIIPIRDERGRVVGFGARALNPDDNPKYLNSPQTPVFDKSKLLFGLDRARQAIRDSETAVIVEGYMDVVQAHQAGFTNVVAQMGTAMTEHQLKRIAPRYATKIILALDADAAGQNATRRSLETARTTLEADYAGRLSVDIRVLQIPGAKDPDDLLRETPDQWEELVQSALPVADFVIRMEADHLPANASIAEREAVARRVLPILTASENTLYKQENIQRLALRLRIGERELLAWANEERTRQQPPASSPHSTAPGASAAPVPVEAPPPIDYDSIEPPPDVDDDMEAWLAVDGQAGVKGRQVEAGRSSLPHTLPTPANRLEHDCLRALLVEPEALYQINRHLRELTAGDQRLQRGPLSDFGVQDFSHAEYRVIMQTLVDAVRQHDMDVLEFIRQHLGPELMPWLEGLLIEQHDELLENLNHRYTADFAIIWKQRQRLRPEKRALHELLEVVLRLRLRRISREVAEYSFLQVEAQNTDDTETAMKLISEISVSKRAREILDAAHQQHLMQFT